MSKIPVSVCIIAKNEEKYIEDCLRHLKKYGWEIVVTDTGSTDRTKEIAAKYADKVLDFEWIDDFAAARNYCASQASNNWILALDCDEFVGEVDISALRILMQKFPRHAGVIRLDNLVIYGSGSLGYNSDDVTRFYNRNYYAYESPIHEQLHFLAAEPGNNTINVFLMPMKVVHHGYAIEGEEMERKQRRNLEMLHKALENNPENGYIYFQIGQSNFVLENIYEAIAAYEKGMGFVQSYDDLYVQEMIISLAKAYDTVGREADALELLGKYSKTYNTPKFTYMHAHMLHEDGQVLKALMLYIKITAMENKDTLGDDLVKCYGNIINIYRAMGQEDMAAVFEDQFVKSFEEDKKILGEKAEG